MADKDSLTAARLREALDYRPDTGVFTWRKKIARKVVVGSVAGCTSPQGYICIRLFGVLHQAHRLAFFYMTSEWLAEDLAVDHINGVRHDNRWANLREATGSINAQNLRRAPSHNKSSGLLGVTWHKQRQKWVAGIKTNGKRRHLGLFDDKHVAHETYLKAKRVAHEGCTI